MPDNTTYFDSNMGNLFVQPEGPNTAIYPLGCHDLGDISESFGDITERRCPNPASPGKWDVVLSSVGVPDRGTTSVTTFLGKTKDWLERQGNESFTLYVQHAHSGRKDLFLNYERGEVLKGCRFTSKTRSNMVTREGSEAAEQSFEMSFDSIDAYYPLTLSEETHPVESEAFTTIAFDETGEYGVAGCASAAAPAFANVYYTRDGGTTWKACAAPPHAAGLDIGSVAIIPLSATTFRIFAALGEGGAGHMLVGYSDNWGASWTLADVGGGNGNFARGPKGLWALDYAHIYVVGDDGDVFFSEDGGASYTEIPTANAQALEGVYFHDTNVGIIYGAANTCLRTLNGGSSWTTISGPAAQAAVIVTAGLIFDQYRILLGYADGEVWYTDDAGETWAQVAFSLPAGFTAGHVADMHCVDDHCIAMALDWEDGDGKGYSTYYRTICGGTYWEAWNTAQYDGASGVNSVWIVEYDLIHGCGDLMTADATLDRLSN